MLSARFVLAISFSICLGLIDCRHHSSVNSPGLAGKYSVQTERPRSGETNEDELVRLISCKNDKNSFLKHLISHKVRILSRPDKLSGMCGEEWAKFGTCCEVESLVSYAEAQSKSLLESTSTFSTDINKLINSTLEGSSQLTKKITDELKSEPEEAPQPEATPNSPEQPEEEEPRSLLLMGSRPRSIFNRFAKFTMSRIKLMASVVKMLKTNLIPFFAAQTKCITKLNQVRSSSLCNTCSARSQVFFSDGKIRMGLDDCKQVIDECKGYWSTLLKYVDSLESVKEVIEEIREKEQDNTEMFKGHQHSNLLKWIEENKLKEHLGKCLSEENCGDKVAGELCASLISIRRKDPLMTTSSKSFENRLKKTNSIFAYTKIYLNTRNKQTQVAENAKKRVVSMFSSMFKSAAIAPATPVARNSMTPMARKLHHSNHETKKHSALPDFPASAVNSDLMAQPFPSQFDSLKSSPQPEAKVFGNTNPEVSVIPDSTPNLSTLSSGSTVINLSSKFP